MRRDPEVIRVYSRSLLEAVQKAGKLPEYIAEARALRQLYLDNPQLQAFLEGPHVREQDKNQLVVKVFGNGQILPLLYNLFRLMIHKKRPIFFPDVLEQFRILGEKALGHEVGKVTTAVPLDDAKKKALEAKLEAATGHDFTLDWLVDPEVLGGVLVQFGDARIDGTLRGRLNEVAKRLEALV